MTEKPTFTDLVDHVEGRLALDAAASVERALEAGDPQTVRAYEWIRSFRSLAERLPLDAPPVRVRHHLRRQFDARSAARPAGSSRRLPRQLAALIFDSRTHPAVAGVRGPGDVGGGMIHLAFRSEVGDVLIDLTPASPDGHRRLDGQVLWTGQGPAALVARLAGPEFAESTGITDHLGRFSFTRVPAEVDRLVLETGSVQVSMTWKTGPGR